MPDFDLTSAWGKVSVNGRLVPAGEAVTSAMDRGFLYGDGVFETVRVYGGTPFMLDAHIARMAEGCSVIGLTMCDQHKLKSAVAEVLAANDLSDAYLRITITRGPTGGAWYDVERADPTVLVIAKPFEQPDFGPGLELGLSRFRSDEQNPLTAVKHTGILWKILARAEARRSGVDDALLLNTGGNIAEATSANVFWVREGALYTPSAESGILRGITRDIVMHIAEENGIRLAQGGFPLDEAKAADEMFLTSSTWEIAPVRMLDGVLFPAGAPGPMTRRLMGLYRERTPRTD